MQHLFIYFLLVHWLADFVFQTDWMAKNKSTSSIALIAHIAGYTLVLIISLLLIDLFLPKGIPASVVGFILINVLSHWIIDYVTSRVSSSLHKVNDTHNFFIVIGFDQLLHIAILYTTYQYFIGPYI